LAKSIPLSIKETEASWGGMSNVAGRCSSGMSNYQEAPDSAPDTQGKVSDSGEVSAT